MRELPLIGLIALGFGVASLTATGELGVFNGANLVLGGGALLVGAIRQLRRVGQGGVPAARRILGRHLVVLLSALLVLGFAESTASRVGLQFDFTLERKFELAPATLDALAVFEEVRLTFFADPYDPRARGTRILLRRLAQQPTVSLREFLLDESPAEEERLEVGSSNTVVIEAGGHFETVPRPTEGSLFEALSRLRPRGTLVLGVAQGEGEGDVDRTDEQGFSGLAAAFLTEGYRVRKIVTAAATEISDDLAALVVLAPQRSLLPTAVAAIASYVDRGGRLVVFLEPGLQSGLEPLLARYGFEAPDGVLVDPASGPLYGIAPGLAPIAYHYARHPITTGLGSTTMSLFPGVRPILLRKPKIEDVLKGIVLSSGRSWISPDVSLLLRRAAPEKPATARQDYHSIVAVGSYPRESGEIRIAVFGDSDFASNRYLRTLYNLDVVMNTLHWTTAREESITKRPKLAPMIQFPLPIQNTLRSLYGVGLLIPEALLLVGGVVWLRRRAS